MSNATKIPETRTKHPASGTPHSRRYYLVTAGVVIVALLGAVLGVVLTRDPGRKKLAAQLKRTSLVGTRTAAPAEAMRTITTVPATVTDTVTLLDSLVYPTPLRGVPPVVRGGKPEVFFAAAEYCPYCAAARWPLIEALSRFGTFTGLNGTLTATTEPFPATPTFSFHGSTYSSQYLTFVPVELYTNKPVQAVAGLYGLLDHPTDADQQLINRYDTPPYNFDDGIPFLVLGNRYVLKAPQFDTAVLARQGLIPVAQQAAAGTTLTGALIDGAANILTAGICDLTQQRPASVCTAPGVERASVRLHAQGRG